MRNVEYRFTEEILTKFENLESITFEAISSNEEFWDLLFACGPNLKFKTTLKELNIHACVPDEVTDEYFENLNEFLNNFPNLEKISLRGKKVGENFVFLAENLKRVKSIDLQSNGFSPTIAANFMNIIDLSTLEELNLGANWIGYDGLRLMKEK